MSKKAARLGDRGRHDKDDLVAVQGSPDVFINGQPAVRVGDMYQPEFHPASQGSSSVNVNGRAVVRVGDMIAGHAKASSGSGNVFIGDASYGAATGTDRPIYDLVLTQVPGSAQPGQIYAEYPYKFYHNGALVQEGRTGPDGVIRYEYEPPLTGTFRCEMGNGDVFEGDLAAMAPAETRTGQIQRMHALGFFHYSEGEDNEDMALEEVNSQQGDKPVNGILDPIKAYVASKMP